MEDSRRLTAEVFIDTGKDFRPEDSLQAEYTCILGETVTLEFDLSVFEHTCGFRFDPLLEDSSMVKLLALTLTYEDEERKTIEWDRIKTNSDVDFEPVFVYLHKDPKFFVDEALCLKLAKAEVSFQVLVSFGRTSSIFCPTKDGTGNSISSGPLLTIRRTTSPFFSVSPAAGSVEIIWPSVMLSLN